MTRFAVPFAFGALLAACSLLAPSREDLTGGNGAPSPPQDAEPGDTSSPPSDGGDGGAACDDVPGDPGPGSVLGGGPLVQEEIVGGIAVDSAFVFVGRRGQVSRFTKTTGEPRGTKVLSQTPEVLHAGGSQSLYAGCERDVFRLVPQDFQGGPGSVVGSAVRSADLASTGERVFATRLTVGDVRELGDGGSSWTAEVSPRAIAIAAPWVYWSVPTSIRRGNTSGGAAGGFVANVPGNAASIAIDTNRIVAVIERAQACGGLYVYDATTGATVAAGGERVGAKGKVVAGGGVAYVSTGTSVIALDLRTLAKKKVGSRLDDCALGLALDATTVYVACKGGKVHVLPR